MIKFAKVTEVSDHYVSLDFNQNKACQDCKSRCSDGFLDFLFRQKDKHLVHVLKSADTTNAAPHPVKVKGIETTLKDSKGFFSTHQTLGETVGVKFDEKSMLFLTILLYGLPLLFIFLGLIFGRLASQLLPTNLSINPDLLGISGMILGLFLAAQWVRKFRKKELIKVEFFK